MPTLVVDEIDINFPFEPYQVQTELMTRVMQCLQNRHNGLLESPTGTGKTLALLCASLAWQNKQKAFVKGMLASVGNIGNNVPNHRSRGGFKNERNSMENAVFTVPKIIYSSRTHSQLSQAIQELKRSFYKNSKAVVLGSREVMCIHEEVSRLENSHAKIKACHTRVHAHTCVYYNNVNQRKEEPTIRQQPVMDIEDLVVQGKKSRFCPFFMSRELVQDAEIVFMPYNYLLDPKLRSSHGIDLKNCVIILDEGHNIARICEEAVSFEIRSSTIALCIQELTRGLNEFTEASQLEEHSALTKNLSVASLVSLKKSFLELETELDKIKATPEGNLLPGNDLLIVLFQSGFPPSALPKIISDLDAISSFLTGSNYETVGCDKFGSIFRVLASQSMFRNPAVFGESYKVFVQFEEIKKNRQDIRSHVTIQNSPKVFNFWCFNPALGLETMMLYGPRCVILASGTLSPISFLVKELQIPFQVQLSNPHIISDDQLFASVVSHGPNNIKLSSNYQNRNDPHYLKSLGELIRQVCTVVPKGVLVFFPSYSVMSICTQEWQSNGQWADIGQQKKLLMEPRGKDAFRQVMDDFYSSVRMSNGACLLAVCRGKVSEGLDFTDDNGRAVIITGIPYSPAKDPYILAKQQYLNSKVLKTDTIKIDGRTWYQLEAVRALNQAVGRIIRHAHDYGAILLCEERCDSIPFQQNLSKWVSQRMQKFPSFEHTISKLATFFGSSVLKSRLQVKMQAESKRSTRNKVGDTMSMTEMAMMNQVVPKTSTESDLKNLYGQQDCCIIKEKSSQQSLTAAKKSSSFFADLSTPTLTQNKADFNSPLPVFAKSFNAFSRSSNADVSIHKRKRIRLVQPGFDSTSDGSEGTSSYSSFYKKAVENSEELNLKPDCEKRDSTTENKPSLNQFTSLPEFWKWVKEVLKSNEVTSFANALKSYKKDKEIKVFGNHVIKLFKGKELQQCVQGLTLVVSKSHVEVLEKMSKSVSTAPNSLFGMKEPTSLIFKRT